MTISIMAEKHGISKMHGFYWASLYMHLRLLTMTDETRFRLTSFRNFWNFHWHHRSM